jgi:xeroderma pigmentosum group C-complementing protein
MKLTPDGKIPQNKYGNIELFNGPLPPECKYLDYPKIMPTAKKLGLDYVPAVIGFEISKGGSHPVIKGAVVFR